MANPDSGKFKPGQNDLDTAERWAAALELRKAGASYDAIARQLGYATPAGAYKAVQGALNATLSDPAPEVRKLEVERLDRLMLAMWSRAIKGDEKAMDRVLSIMERRARLLGLDAPSKQDFTTGGKPIETGRRLSDLDDDDLDTLHAIARKLAGGGPDGGAGGPGPGAGQA